MANLAALIREAERMRGAVRIVGPEPDAPCLEPVGAIVPKGSAHPAGSALHIEAPEFDLPSWSNYREPDECAREEESPAGKPEARVHLTEEQMDQLRASLAPAPEVMTLSEAAAYLRVGRSSILDMVHDEGMPAAKLAGKWRFKRSAVDQWLEFHLSHYPRSTRN
jgi:excisionase family DNA binding protein